jgi:bacillithiol system protein YtxJ
MVIELLKQEDLEQLLDRSKTNPILIFKHSTQCPISAEAYEEFVRFTTDNPDVPSGLVLVIEHRAISDAIESTLHVRHASPQAIVVENGQQRSTASHWAITADALRQAVKG